MQDQNAYLIPSQAASTAVWSLIVLRKPTTKIGRGPCNDCAIDTQAGSASQVSREHCVVRWEEGHWSIEDLKSLNGVYVAGCRIQNRTRLDEGQHVVIGNPSSDSSLPYVFHQYTFAAAHGQLLPQSIALAAIEFPSGGGELTIGRGAKATVQLDDPQQTLSRVHAKVWQAGSSFHIQNCSTTNGLYVNGRRVSSAVELQLGDNISLGMSERFRYAFVILPGNAPRAPEQPRKSPSFQASCATIVEEEPLSRAQLRHIPREGQAPHSAILLSSQSVPARLRADSRGLVVSGHASAPYATIGFSRAQGFTISTRGGLSARLNQAPISSQCRLVPGDRLSFNGCIAEYCFEMLRDTAPSGVVECDAPPEPVAPPTALASSLVTNKEADVALKLKEVEGCATAAQLSAQPGGTTEDVSARAEPDERTSATGTVEGGSTNAAEKEPHKRKASPDRVPRRRTRPQRQSSGAQGPSAAEVEQLQQSLRERQMLFARSCFDVIDSQPRYSGTYGSGFHAHQQPAGVKVFVKQFHRRRREEEDLFRELGFMQRAQSCPFIIRLLGVIWEAGSHSLVYEVGLPLRTLLNDERPAPSVLQGFAEHLCTALVHLHSLEPAVVHNDVKLDNAVVVHQRCCLVDFGLAVNEGDAPPCPGTAGYSSPARGQRKSLTTATDVYAFACLLKKLFKDTPLEKKHRKLLQRMQCPELAGRPNSAHALSELRAA